MMIAATTTTNNVVPVGFKFKKKPNATPASETWDRVSAINDCRRITRKTPSIGAIPAIKIAAFPYPVHLSLPYEEPFSVKSPVQLALSDIDYIVYRVCANDKERFPVSSEVEPLSLSHGEKVSAVVHPCSHPVARTE